MLPSKEASFWSCLGRLSIPQRKHGSEPYLYCWQQTDQSGSDPLFYSYVMYPKVTDLSISIHWFAVVLKKKRFKKLKDFILCFNLFPIIFLDQLEQNSMQQIFLYVTRMAQLVSLQSRIWKYVIVKRYKKLTITKLGSYNAQIVWFLKRVKNLSGFRFVTWETQFVYLYSAIWGGVILFFLQNLEKRPTGRRCLLCTSLQL